ncbi:MAG TPA: DMT family transporter [Kiritimatiellia bacterium]|nr:DMT family transporter [Kiritimatiellia bacterium]HMO97897.1 DMT family transporter [Kiritimatiellia bacterium]HMP95583.1 DMT family transporter [Kiritimatiellia bacterium]
MSAVASTGSLYPQSLKHGALFLIGAASVFSVVSLLVKALLSDLPVAMVVFFRNAGGFIFLLPLVLARRSLTLKTYRIGDHSVRALSGVLAMYCFFFAIARLPLAEAVTLNFTSPLLIPILAYAVLREAITRRIAGLLALGFCGALLIIKPGFSDLPIGALAGLLSALFAAFALVNIRKLASTEPAFRIVFYFALIGSLISLPPMLFMWKTPDLFQAALLAGVGAGATLGQWLLTRGYASAPAGQIGYFQYSAVVFAGLMDWWLWHESPDLASVIGMVIICAAGIAASRQGPISG